MYLSLIVFCILLYNLAKNKTNKETIKWYISTITIILIIVSSIRHEAVGNDTYAYMQHFDNISSLHWENIFENFWDSYFYPGVDGNGKDPGELIIIKGLSIIIPNSRCFLFIVATLLMVPLGIFVYKNTQSLETPCFFYVFYITMFYPYLPNSAIRQSLSLSILLIGYILWQKGKTKYFILCLLIATFVHKSVFIVLMILPFYYFKKTRLLYRLSFILFLIMLFSYQHVGTILGSQSEIYERYATGGFYENHSAPYMVIVMMLCLYLIGWFVIKNDENSYKQRLIYGGAAMTLIWAVMVRLDPSIIRLTAYFGPWMGLMVPHALRLWRKKEYKIIFAIILLVFILRACITPDNYHFLWEEVKLHDRYY